MAKKLVLQQKIMFFLENNQMLLSQFVFKT